MLMNINAATWPEGKAPGCFLWLCTLQTNCCLCQAAEQQQPYAPAALAAL